jgi:hypothetical protein
MVKKTYKRKQSGGDWYNPMSWFSDNTTDPYAPPKKSWSDWWSEKTGSAEASLASASESISSGAQNMMSSANQYLSQDVNLTGSQQNQAQQPVQNNNQIPIQNNNISNNNSLNNNAIGGKKRKSRSKSYKGGKGLGITYYATPVSDMKTAQPNYWIKGGKKINRKSKNKRKQSRKVKKTRRYYKK